MSAFSAATLGQTIGLFLGTLFSTFFCTKVKVLFYIGLILFGLICYMILAIKRMVEQKDEKQNQVENKKLEQNVGQEVEFEEINTYF
jgi:hypothetical protein